MFKKDDSVIIKTLDTLIKEGFLKKSENCENLYYSYNKDFIVFEDFNYFGKKTSIKNIDSKDPNLKYFLECGVWVPEYLIIAKEDPIEEDNEFVEVGDIEKDIKDIPEQKVDNKIIMNTFVNKPFGILFCKLINLDPKVAEFSNIAFSKLKKHELVYIANNILERDKKHNDMLKEDLVKFCFRETCKL